MTKGHLDNYVGCVPRTEYYLLVRRAHPAKYASHVAWLMPPIFMSPYLPTPPDLISARHARRGSPPSPSGRGNEGEGERARGEGTRRIQQNIIVRWVSLRLTQPTCKLKGQAHESGADHDA